MAMQVGGWYGGKQFNGTSLGAKGQITVGNGKSGGGGGGGGGGSPAASSNNFSRPAPPPPPPPMRSQSNKSPWQQADTSTMPSQPMSRPILSSLPMNLGSNPVSTPSAMMSPVQSAPQMSRSNAPMAPVTGASKPSAKASPTPAPLASPQQKATASFVSGTPDWVKPMVAAAGQKYNIPTQVLSALLKQESGFNPHISSGVGAQGIAQFMPETAKSYGIDPNDPTQAIDAAGKYLRSSLDTFGGDMSKALASYNAGTGAVQQYNGIPPYQETQNYVKNIQAMANEATPPEEVHLNGPSAAPPPSDDSAAGQALAARYAYMYGIKDPKLAKEVGYLHQSGQLDNEQAKLMADIHNGDASSQAYWSKADQQSKALAGVQDIADKAVNTPDYVALKQMFAREGLLPGTPNYKGDSSQLAMNSSGGASNMNLGASSGGSNNFPAPTSANFQSGNPQGNITSVPGGSNPGASANTPGPATGNAQDLYQSVAQSINNRNNAEGAGDTSLVGKAIREKIRKRGKKGEEDSLA